MSLRRLATSCKIHHALILKVEITASNTTVLLKKLKITPTAAFILSAQKQAALEYYPGTVLLY